MGSSYLPPPEQNVVNVGDELSQTALDAINAATFPSGTNPFRTLSDGGTIDAYDNFKVYQGGDIVIDSNKLYKFNSTIGAAGYGPSTHPYAWTALSGEKGDTGSPGPQGQEGTQGPQGPQGVQGVSAYNWRGAYQSGEAYYPMDIVSSGGSSWVCIQQAGANVYPDGYPSYWQMLASVGETGPQGPAGDPGGPEGPQGPVGPQGSQGDPGPQGQSGQPISTWSAGEYHPNDIVWDSNVPFVPFVALNDIYGTTTPPSQDPANWGMLGNGYYAKLNGATFTGKINTLAPTSANAGINIGSINSQSVLTGSVAGDVWIGTYQMTYKNAQGNVVYGAATNIANTFNAPQIIDTTNSAPALRVTQKGTGNVLLVEDSLNPDTTALVVDTSGNVGIGVATGYTATQKVEVVGNVKATSLMTGSGPAFSVNSVATHTPGGDTHNLIISVNGSTYRIGMVFVSTP
jgi:hypothetical protein